MQNFIQKLIQMDIRATLSTLWKRFPLPVLLVFAVSLLWLYIVNIDDNQDWTYRTIITGIVVFFLATAVVLIHEQVKLTRVVRLATWLVPIIFGACFYLAIDGVYDGDIEAVTYTFLALSGFFATLFVAPFVPGFFTGKGENPTHFSNYFTQISWVVLMSLVVGGVLMLLGSIAIASVLALFDIESWVDEWDLFGNWAVVSLILTAPLYALASLPYVPDYETKTFIQNKFFSFIIRYIATPFIFVYFLILYAYSAKVLMNFSDWPKGIVSWMVIGFSSFGYLIYILSRAYTDESRMVAVFRQYFPYMVAPQILMLGYAIYLRIAQYDLTMNRYFVVVFGIWLTLISLYYIISAKKYLSFIPTSLVVIIVVISFGPWSVYSLPLARQEVRLMTNLETARILQNGNIVPLASAKDISKELSNDIYSGISYVCDFRDCEIITRLFVDQYEQADMDARKEWLDYTYEWKKPYTKPTKWQIVSAVTTGIKVQQSWWSEGVEPPYLQFNTKWTWVYPLDITGYDQIVSVYGSGMGNIIPSKDGNMGLAYITLDADTNKLTYHRVGLADIVMTLPTRTDLTSASVSTGLESSDLTFSLTGETLDMMLYLDSYAIRNPNYIGEKQVQSYYGINGVALIRDKK
jgi:Domain of unknown function (DUF4153)